MPVTDPCVPQRRTRADVSIDAYCRTIRTCDGLSRAEEAALCARIQAGDIEARNALATANLQFAMSVAAEYVGRGLPMADLIAAANTGLLTAADRFDASKGFKFISYAVHWCRQAIHEAIARQTRAVRLPSNQIDNLHRQIRAGDALTQHLGRYPTYDELAEATGHHDDAVWAQRHTVLSIDDETAAGSGTSLQEALPDPDPLPDEAADGWARSARAARALAACDPRERDILERLYGFDGEGAKTLEAVAAHYGLTRERIRQIRNKALARAQRAVRAHQIEEA